MPGPRAPEQPLEQTLEQLLEQPLKQPLEQPLEEPMEQPLEEPLEQPMEQPMLLMELPMERTPSLWSLWLAPPRLPRRKRTPLPREPAHGAAKEPPLKPPQARGQERQME